MCVCLGLPGCLFNTSLGLDCKWSCYTHTALIASWPSQPACHLFSCYFCQYFCNSLFSQFFYLISGIPPSFFPASSVWFLNLFLFPSLFLCLCERPLDGNKVRKRVRVEVRDGNVSFGVISGIFHTSAFNFYGIFPFFYFSHVFAVCTREIETKTVLVLELGRGVNG